MVTPELMKLTFGSSIGSVNLISEDSAWGKYWQERETPKVGGCHVVDYAVSSAAVAHRNFTLLENAISPSLATQLNDYFSRQNKFMEGKIGTKVDYFHKVRYDLHIHETALTPWRSTRSCIYSTDCATPCRRVLASTRNTVRCGSLGTTEAAGMVSIIIIATTSA